MKSASNSEAKRGIIWRGRKAPPKRLPKPVKLRKLIDLSHLIAEDRQAR